MLHDIRPPIWRHDELRPPTLLDDEITPNTVAIFSATNTITIYLGTPTFSKLSDSHVKPCRWQQPTK